MTALQLAAIRWSISISIFALLGIAGPAAAVARPVGAEEDAPWPERPNIVWLIAEDLGPWLPAFGDPTAETPNLDRLAREGVRYSNVFSPSGVCAPSRAALATGQYPTRIGAHHMRTGPWAFPGHEAVNQRPPMPGLVFYEAVPAPEVRMHSELLRQAGYYTSNNAKDDYQFKKPVTAWDESSQQAHWRGRVAGQPFFAVFTLTVTHESQIWARADQPMTVSERKELPVPPYLPKTEVALRDIRRMYSNIEAMDRQVGELLAQLEADELLHNTIVMWFTDHGGPLPRQKRLLYDSGIQAPMIVRYPSGWRAGEFDEQLISFVDFKPTLLSMAGAAVPEYVDGRVFVGPGVDSPPRRYVHAAADRFDEVYDKSRAVRDQHFKYIRHLETDRPYYLPLAYREQMPIMQELLRLRDGGELDEIQRLWFREQRPREELFDTRSDPQEVRNLAADPAQAQKLAELRAECDRWMAHTSDRGLLDEKEFLETIWPGQVQPVTQPPSLSESEIGWVIEAMTEGSSLGYQVLSEEEDPGQRWLLFTEPIALAPDQRLVALAHRIGFRQSDLVERRGSPSD